VLSSAQMITRPLLETNRFAICSAQGINPKGIYAVATNRKRFALVVTQTQCVCFVGILPRQKPVRYFAEAKTG
jgi:hypothetical protein